VLDAKQPEGQSLDLQSFQDLFAAHFELADEIQRPADAIAAEMGGDFDSLHVRRLETGAWADGRAGWQTDRQTDRQAGRPAGR
jgi:hypothetical protein